MLGVGYVAWLAPLRAPAIGQEPLVFGVIGDSGEVTMGLLRVCREMEAYRRDRGRLIVLMLRRYFAQLNEQEDRLAALEREFSTETATLEKAVGTGQCALVRRLRARGLGAVRPRSLSRLCRT